MMRAFHRFTAALCGLLLSVTLASCGGSDSGAFSGSTTSTTGSGSSTTGSGSTTTGTNTATVTVGPGATGNSINTLFVSVTVCVPGSTTNCQTIPNIQVDTGSTGLRILASALSVTLPTQTASNGGALLECLNFVDGYIWGPVALADVQVGGEGASNVPVQVIGDSRYPNVPSDCAATSTATAEDTVATFGANGIIGISPFQYDCSSGTGYEGCDQAAIPGAYYGCTSTTAASCTASEATLAQQVQSVVALFASDNNGVILDLPAVASPAVGAATLTGTLYFGIDTQADNASGTQTLLTTDNEGDITIQFNGQTLGGSFLDSGTNGIYFNDSSIAQCSQSGLSGFYCPTGTTPVALTATLLGQNDISAVVNFGIANAYTMLSTNESYSAFPDFGGVYSDATDTFDFGLPFFYGRRVAVAMQGLTTTVGTGPYFAF